MTIAIKVRHLNKTYGNFSPAKDISFDVPVGQVFALLGANGSGKTTTINMLSTLIKPNGGSVTIMGHDLTETDQIQKHISVNGQYATLDEDLTGKQNMLTFARLNHLSKHEMKTRISDLLTHFDLLPFANKAVATYSGGMRRRLDIALSLLSDAEILFLDEPTTGVDPQNRIALWQIIHELVAKGKTIFLTTQYLEEAEELADKIVVLHQGMVISEGTVDELKTRMDRQIAQVTFKTQTDLQKAMEIQTLQTSVDKLTIEYVGTSSEIQNLIPKIMLLPHENILIREATLEESYLKLLEEA